MGAPGPPGGYDLPKYFRGPPQSPYPPPQSGGYQPTSPGGYHQPLHSSSYPPGSTAPAPSFQANPNTTYSNILPGPNYTYNAPAPQQSGSPVYHHSQQFSLPFHGLEMTSQAPPPALLPAVPTAPPVPAAAAAPAAPGMRFQGSKTPKGRPLRGEHVVYDIDVRKPGEAQPQLEVSAITMYSSDSRHVLGRQIAVNKKFICYGLRGGHIRILNINNAQRALLRGHSQRVSDMAFFSENVHLLASASEDGRIFVNRIHEGPGDDRKLTENVLFAVQLVGDWETCHPRLCWHPSNQNIIFIAIGRYVVMMDMSKAEQLAGAGGFNAAEHPVVDCRVGNPLKGVSVVAQHDDVVTDLDVSLSGPFRLASASKDGTVRIWGEQKQYLAMFEPYEGNAVDAVAYISAPQRGSDRQCLITGGPSNQVFKLWAVDDLPSKAPKCMQTLEFQSSSTSKTERAFYNQVIGAPRAGLILVANTNPEKNAIYAIHLDFAASSGAPRMDYLAEFAVAWPIVSLTVAEDAVTNSGEGTLKVFCVQTQAIQQHSLDLSQCTPPPGTEDLHSEGSTPSTPKKGLHHGAAQSQYIPISIAFTTTERCATLSSTGTVNVPSLSSNPGIPPRAPFSSLLDAGSRYLTTEPNRVTETTKSTASRDSQDTVKTSSPGPAFAAFAAGEQLNASKLIIRNDGLSSSNPLSKPPTPPPRRRSRSRSPARLPDMSFVSIFPGFLKQKATTESRTETVKDSTWLDGGQEATVDDPPTTLVDDDTFEKEPERQGLVSGGVKPSPIIQPLPFRSPHLISPSDIMSLATKHVKGDHGDGAPNLMDAEDWQDGTQQGLSRSKHGNSGTGSFQDKVAEAALDSIPTDELSDGDEPTVSSLLEAFEGDDDRGTQFVEKEISEVQNSSIDVDHNSTGLELPAGLIAIVDDYQNEYFVEEKAGPPCNSDAESQDELKVAGLSTLAKPGSASSASQFTSSPATVGFKGRRNKNKNNNNGNNGAASGNQPGLFGSAAAASSQPSSAPATLPGSSLDPALVSQVATMQESFNQLLSIQRELQKQMTVLVAAPVAKEAKRLEGAFGQRMEKVVKQTVDTMWARLADENAKREKQDRERAQQVSTLVSNFVKTDLPSALERGLKKESAAFGPAVAQSMTVPLQKSVSTGVTETFQGAIEKFLPQLEKTTVAKLEAAITRQLKTQFQTSGRQTLQEALRAGFESLVIPAFERSCQAMSEQMDTAFQTDMAEHTANAQQQLASTNSALATTLQEVICSASMLQEDLLASTAKLVELVETASANALQYGEINQTKGGLPAKALSVEHVEQSLDPTIELHRLMKEGKFDEAFNKAFASMDLQLVSWLCLQLDPSALLATVPLPVSQGVLLSLVRQLSYDLLKDTGPKLLWIKEAALALNPDDPILVTHLRAYLEPTYQNCHSHMAITTVQSEQSMLRLVMHLINSLLSSCN